MYIGFDNGHFIVINFYGKNKNRENLWECLCKCGKKVIHRSSSLKRKDIKSCGCGRKGINKNITHTKKHGLSFHPIYSIWKGIKERCKSDKDAKYYRDKNIVFCEEWKKDFLIFYDWALNNGWKEGLSIDRIDNNSGYNPLNCRFITRSENSKRTPTINRRGESSHLNKLSEKDVEEIRNLLSKNVKGVEIAKKFNVCKQTIYCIKNKKSWKWKG